jgi:hypothetical protein
LIRPGSYVWLDFFHGGGAHRRRYFSVAEQRLAHLFFGPFFVYAASQGLDH